MIDNPSGDFKSMHRHICKGSWPLADRDHAWQVSDATAECFKVTNYLGYKHFNLLEHSLTIYIYIYLTTTQLLYASVLYTFIIVATRDCRRKNGT